VWHPAPASEDAPEEPPEDAPEELPVLEPCAHVPPAWHVVPMTVQFWQGPPPAPQAVSPTPATQTPPRSQQPLHDGPHAVPPPLLAPVPPTLLPLPPLFAVPPLPLLAVPLPALLPDDGSGGTDEPTSPGPTSPTWPASSPETLKSVSVPLAQAKRPVSPTRTRHPPKGPLLDMRINCLRQGFCAHRRPPTGRVPLCCAIRQCDVD